MGTDYAWDFLSVFTNFNVLMRGLVGTVRLGVVCLALGFTAGLFIGAARFSRRWYLHLPASAYIEMFRNTPALVQIMWFFFAFPILVQVDIDAFTAAAMALSANTAAFSAEIFRGGIQSIARGQWEAGRALGLSYAQVMRHVVLPQAVKRMIPAFTNRGIELTKMTSLSSTIAFADLLYQGKLLSAVTFRPIETYTTVAVIYFIILFGATTLIYRIERRLRTSE